MSQPDPKLETPASGGLSAEDTAGFTAPTADDENAASLRAQEALRAEAERHRALREEQASSVYNFIHLTF